MRKKRVKKWDSPESFLDWLENWEGLPQFVKKARPLLITTISVIIVVIIYMIIGSYVNRQFSVPVNPKERHMVVFQINRGETLSTVSRKLVEQNLIRNKWAFKLFADFSNKSDKLQAGSYFISKSMTMEEILDTFIRGIDSAGITRIQLTEGMTIDDMVAKLESAGLVKNKAELINILKTGKGFNDLSTFKNLENESKRKYLLEGYLFPDTYEFFLSATDQDIIEKLINRFNNIFDQELRDRAKELDLSVDEVLTLASIIEKEGKIADFDKVSAVLHNRLKKDMKLESDSTIKYITGTKRIIIDNEINTETPYNTYKYKGLPPGPICNPSKNAILAALYPDEEYIDGKYLFFTTKDPKDGTLEFSKTLAQHQTAVNKYRHLWEEYDNNIGK